ncbi:hypothetical protein [Celeribacter sp.]|uniref:hypothetical protein n=1 Tax=Celeribacter sp. TaxID=1890673 RepID=UPI003A94C152
MAIPEAITPFDLSVTQISDLTFDQSIDVFEALCAAIHGALKADYQHFIAKGREARMAQHVEAIEAWARVNTCLSTFSNAAWTHPALVNMAVQLTAFFNARIHGRTHKRPNIDAMKERAAEFHDGTPQDERLAELFDDAVGYELYMRDNRLPVPDISDLLSS